LSIYDRYVQEGEKKEWNPIKEARKGVVLGDDEFCWDVLNHFLHMVCKKIRRFEELKQKDKRLRLDVRRLEKAWMSKNV